MDGRDTLNVAVPSRISRCANFVMRGDMENSKYSHLAYDTCAFDPFILDHQGDRMNRVVRGVIYRIPL